MRTLKNDNYEFLKKYIAVLYYFDIATFGILINFKCFIDKMFYLIVRRYT